MKKLIYLTLGLVAVISAGSCQKEINYLEGETSVKFELTTGEIATKAIADGTNIDVLYWELYGADPATAATPLGEGIVRDSDGDKKFTVELKLVADQNYNIVFWAQVDGKQHYIVDDLRSVKINTYADESANDETRAAFFAVYPFHTENGIAINETVILKRPFSQLNLGATTYETSLNLVNDGMIKVETTEVTVSNIADSFNTLAGVGETSSEFDGVVTFQAAATPNGELDQTTKILEVKDINYYWLGMNYLIVNGDSDNVSVDITLNTNMGSVNHIVDNVPVKENYRTNILGNLLTTGAKFNIEIDAEFDGDIDINADEFVTVKTIADLQSAINQAEGTKQIILGNDLVGNVTILQKENVNLIINGNDKKFDGVITINGDGRASGSETLTIQNINFETEGSDFAFINAPESASHNVTIENCTFIGNNTVDAASFTDTYNLVMKSCSAENMNSILQVEDTNSNVLVEDVTVNNCENGLSFGNTANPTLKSSTINAVEYGVRAEGNASRGNLVIEDTEINAATPVIVCEVTSDGYSAALEGSTLNASEEFDVVFTSGSDDAAFAAPEHTWTITGADDLKVFPNELTVSTLDELNAALAANSSSVIVLSNNITFDENFELRSDVTIDLNGNSIEAGSPSRVLDIYSNVTFMNGTIESKVYARTDSDIVFEGVTFGGSISSGRFSTDGLLQIEGACNVYAKDCTFNSTNSGSGRTRPLSIENTSSGTYKFENCTFQSNSNQEGVEVSELSGTASLNFTDCGFRGTWGNRAASIELGSSFSLSNLSLTGNEGGLTIRLNRPSTSLTESEQAIISAIRSNNSDTIRIISSDREME